MEGGQEGARCGRRDWTSHSSIVHYLLSPLPLRAVKAAAGALVSGCHALCTCHGLAQPETPANWANLGCACRWAELGGKGQQLQGQCEQEEVPRESSTLYTSRWATELQDHLCQLGLFVLELAVSGRKPRRVT